MTDDLRERVARAIENSLLTAQLRDAFEHPYLAEADAAIALVRAETLEEAARECRYQDEYSDAPSAHAELMTCARNAAAIRALKDKP